MVLQSIRDNLHHVYSMYGFSAIPLNPPRIMQYQHTVIPLNTPSRLLSVNIGFH